MKPQTENWKRTFDAETQKTSNTFGQKLYAARRAKKLSQGALAGELGKYNIQITLSGISKWEKGLSLPNVWQLLAICCILGIDDPVSYFTGITPESADFSPELDTKGLHILQSVRDALVECGRYTPQKSRRVTAMAEQIEMRTMRISINRASAGCGNFLDEDQFERMEFPVSQIPAHADFGIRITGDSMIPYYSDGQIVWVERCRELNPGEVGIFICDGEGYIKQYCEEMPSVEELEEYTCDGVVRPKICLVSFNKDCYPPRPVRPNERLEIIGRVLN